MSVICTICARGGSVGVPNKNIALLHGKPLIEYTIEQAQAVPEIDGVAVSSDCPRILEVASRAGVQFLIKRPAELATSSAPKLPVIRHCVEAVEARVGQRFETVMDLDPTSPLRQVEDITKALTMFTEDPRAQILITGSPSRKNPYFNMVERDANGVARLCKPPQTALNGRQQCPQVFDMNASIYLWRRGVLAHSHTLWGDHTLLYEMPEDRSVDIDTSLDLAFVEFLMARKAALNAP